MSDLEDKAREFYGCEHCGEHKPSKAYGVPGGSIVLCIECVEIVRKILMEAYQNG